MRITITDNAGNVFAVHSPAEPEVRRLADLDDVEIGESELLEDLRTAARNERRTGNVDATRTGNVDATR